MTDPSGLIVVFGGGNINAAAGPTGQTGGAGGYIDFSGGTAGGYGYNGQSYGGGATIGWEFGVGRGGASDFEGDLNNISFSGFGGQISFHFDANGKFWGVSGGPSAGFGATGSATNTTTAPWIGAPKGGPGNGCQ